MQTEISKVSREEIEVQTLALQNEVAALAISGPSDLDTAKALEKQCTSLEKLIETKRTELTVPMNDALKWINAQAKELANPITKAKEDIRAKQIEYAQKIEAERLTKEREVLAIIQKINTTPDDMELEMLSDSISNTDQRIGVAIETRRQFFAEQVRLAEFAQKQKEEQGRLDKIRKEQGIEAARLEKEQAEERLRKQQAEDEKNRILEDGKRREMEELAEAEAKRKEREAEANAPKGMRKVLRFEVSDASLVPIEYCTPDDVKIRAALKEGIREISGVRIWSEDKIQ